MRKLFLILLCLWLSLGHVVLAASASNHITAFQVKLSGAGEKDAVLKKAISQLPLKVGGKFNTADYHKSLQKLLNAALQRGYLDAQISQRKVEIHRKKRQVRIDWTLETGPAYYFGPLHFEPSPFADEFLLRYTDFKTGDRYSGAALLSLQQKLNNSGYFRSVTVTPQRKKAKKHRIPVTVKMTPRKSQSYTLGAGYGTDTGARGRAGWQWRYLNPYGHHMSARAQISQKNSHLSLQYTIPGKDPTHDTYTLSAIQETTDTDSGETFTQKLRAADRRRWQRWSRTFATDLQYEEFTKRGMSERSSTLLVPSLQLSRINTDNPLNPINGTRVDLLIRGAIRNMISPLSFLQVRADGKYLKTLSENQRLLLRGSVGFSAVEDFKRLPLSLNFTTGGSQTVRGYSYESLGPGRNLLVVSAEYQYRVSGPWYAAVFFDAGNAMDDFKVDSLKTAWGVGVVRQTQLGPIQLSVAFPAEDEDTSWRIVFNIGTLLV